MTDLDDLLALNLRNWEARAEIHATDRTGSYRIADLLAGRSVLHAIEAAELGEIAGLAVLHLQCHIGLDTISLAHLGAVATGVDFSPTAIAAARDFAARAGRDVRFLVAELGDVPRVLPETFDRVFTSWGAINWLPDIALWARVVAALLKPGGVFHIVDGHPTTLAFAERDGRLVPTFPWRTTPETPVAGCESHTYTGDERPVAHPNFVEWIHPLSAIVTALIDAGLRIDHLREFEHLAWRAFPSLVEDGIDLFRFPDGGPRLPLSFAIRATKPG